MQFLRHLLKDYPFSMVCIGLVWTLSLVPFFPETPLDNVDFIDKWVHLVMYGGTCMVIWAEYYWKHSKYDYEKLFFWAWLAPVLMSGILELLQEYCTGGHRNGDWLDFLANSLGVTIAAVIGLILLRLLPKH